MTTCSSSSDDPDLTSTSDVDDDISQCANDEVSLGLVQEPEEDGNRLSSKLKTASSQYDGDGDDDSTANCTGVLITYSSDDRQQVMDSETACDADSKSEVPLTSCHLNNSRLDSSVTVCPANGLIAEIPALSADNCVNSSQAKPSSFETV